MRVELNKRRYPLQEETPYEIVRSESGVSVSLSFFFVFDSDPLVYKKKLSYQQKDTQTTAFLLSSFLLISKSDYSP